MTGDVAALVTGVLGIMAFIKGSCVPILFLLAWYLLLYFMMYRHYVSCNEKANIFFWTIAMFQQGKYRFWRMVNSIRHLDFSLAFKGQYFGIYHIKSDYQNSVKKIWLYYDSIFILIIAMIFYRFIV